MHRKERHVTDYRHIFAEAKRRLPDSNFRFNEDASTPMRDVCLQGLSSPTLDEVICSGYGVSPDPSVKKMTEDFWKEIQTIEECIKESDLEIHLADWQRRGAARSEESERMFKGFNLRAYALQMWEWYAIPLRYQDQKVFAIWAPQDAMGTPIIHAYDTGFFLLQYVQNRIQEAEQKKKVERKLEIWSSIAILLIIAFGLLLYSWIF